MEEELGKQVNRQSVVARLASQALFENDLVSVLDEASMLMAQVLEVDYCGFFEFHELQPVLRAGTGWNEFDLGKPLTPFQNSQISYTHEFGEPTRINQKEAHMFVTPHLFVERGIQASLTEVVRSRTRTYGVLGAFTKTDRVWTSDEASFLRTVASLIGGLMMRFEVESALSASESRYRELFQDAPAAYHEIDREGCIRKVNHTECEWLGYSEAELLGRPIWELVAEGERAASEAAVRRKLVSSGELTPFCRTYQRRDGSAVEFHICERRIMNGLSQDGIYSIMVPATGTGVPPMPVATPNH